MGKIPLLLRGLKKVSTEINLYTTVYNLKRLLNLESHEQISDKIMNYDWGIFLILRKNTKPRTLERR